MSLAGFAGLVNPDEAGTGALVGGALPALQVAGKRRGTRLARCFAGPAQTRRFDPSCESAARSSGYAIPPTQASRPRRTGCWRASPGSSRRHRTPAPRIRARRTPSSNSSWPCSRTTKLTPDVLTNVRNAAGQRTTPSAPLGRSRRGRHTPRRWTTSRRRTSAPGFPERQAVSRFWIWSGRWSLFDARVLPLPRSRNCARRLMMLQHGKHPDIARASKVGGEGPEDAIEDHLSQSGAAACCNSFRDARGN